MPIGEKIRLLRKEKGLTQQDLAKSLKMSDGNISKYELGRLEPSNETIKALADFFGVSTDYLFGKTGEDAPDQRDATQEKIATLTARDERDISRSLEATLAQLQSAQDGLMFDGEPLDDDTRELLETSLRNSMEFAKRLAKKKYTPKKYRKDDQQ